MDTKFVAREVIFENLFKRYSKLESCKEQIAKAFEI